MPGTIGLGTTLEINDGASNAFQTVPDVTSITPPADKLGIAVSKRLNLTNGLLGKVGTTTDGGDFTFTYEYVGSVKTRIDALKGASKSYRITPNGGTAFTVPGILTENILNEVQADEIMTCTATVTVNGATS